MAFLDIFRAPRVESNPTEDSPVFSEAEAMGLQVEVLTERLAELELALEDQDWQRAGAQYDREFSREGLRRIIAMSRLAGLKHPLINRAVTLQAIYVWAQGFTVSARHEHIETIIQEFMDDPKNQVELTSHQARTMKEVELQVTGNIFFVFFTNAQTGRVTVRTVPVEDIADSVCNPDDDKDPWFYKRVWQQRVIKGDGSISQYETRTAYYPDWRHEPSDRRPILDGHPVMWDSPLYHVKVGGYSNMRFGIPETYAALDWARAYKEFLEDWATLVRALSRFAWKVTTKGGTRGVASAKTRLESTLGDGSLGPDRNPPPVTGATFIAGDGNDLTPIPKTGTTTSADDGRRMLLMVAAATGLPETFFGDADAGTLATAKSLDRPTELKFRDRQSLWKDIWNDILQYVIKQSAKSTSGLLSNPTGEVDFGVDGEGNKVETTLDIDFPPVVEHDPAEAVKAVVSAITLDGKSPAELFSLRDILRLLATAIGMDDIDDLLDRMAPENGEPTDEPFKGPEPEPVEPFGQKPGEIDPAFMEAVRQLYEAARSAA